MAIIDLPALPGFEGARFELTLEVSESGFQGFYTGNRQRQSTLADRLSGLLVLPPTVDLTLQARKEALIFGLRSAGDLLRMQPPHRKGVLGTIYGTITASANALAGARSISLAGAYARPNLLLNSGFETDTNVDGLANGWTQYSTGTTGTITPTRVTGNGSTWAQRLDATGLGSTGSDQVGIYYSGDANVTAGLSYALAADTRDNGVAVRLHIDWYNGGASIISSTTGVFASSGATWTRRSVAGVAPTGAVVARIYVWMESKTGGPAAAAIEIDNVQFEQAAASTGYAGPATLLAGSFIGTGGNLLHVAFAGALATDGGAITVPLTMPLPKAVTSGAAVSLAPTSLWEWDSDAPQFSYSPGLVQGQVTLPLRQVIA